MLQTTDIKATELRANHPASASSAVANSAVTVTGGGFSFARGEE